MRNIILLFSKQAQENPRSSRGKKSYLRVYLDSAVAPTVKKLLWEKLQ